MKKRFNKTCLLACCVFGSILLHLLSAYALRLFGSCDFATPVCQPAAVMVDLAKAGDRPSATPKPEDVASRASESVREEVESENVPVSSQEMNDSTPLAAPDAPHPVPEPAAPPAIVKAASEIAATNSTGTSTNQPVESRPAAFAISTRLPLRAASEFLATRNEKLTYSISLLGLPVGSAELGACNENGEIRISLRVRSNTAISSVFPVDDIVETRHIDGRFIMAKIRQQEGSFRGDSGFTINLGKKRVSWEDHIRGRSLKMTVPSDEVLDTLSGFYYLRNRQLQVGRTEVLHIFDSETYSEVPVEILRREEVRLPNLRKVAALVVRPLQKTAGIFRRTGEILIWLTDDANKVPVRIVTSIALGRVTAELVSAETGPNEGAGAPPNAMHAETVSRTVAEYPHTP